MNATAIVMVQEPPRMSSAEYLAMEREASGKHMLWAGEVFAMAGASFAHNRLSANLAHVFTAALRGGACVALSSDMKVHVPAFGGFVYPDLSVVCGEPKFADDRRDVILNPSVLVEVLSPSTERFDRGDKFVGYRSLPALRDYLLVDQSRVQVEHYRRWEGKGWLLDEYGPGDVFSLAGGEGRLVVDEIYRDVPLAGPEPEPADEPP